MLRISDTSKIKITSIKYHGAIIHFKYDNKNYFIQNGGTDYTAVIKLFEGRTKFKNKIISSNYGMSLNLIKYIGNKKVLSFIDKDNFINELVKFDLVEKVSEGDNE